MGELLLCPVCMLPTVRWTKEGPPPEKMDGIAPCACEGCHAQRVKALPVEEPTDQFNPIGDERYEIPSSRCRRPHSDGRRVIRKSEPMGG